MSTGKSRPVRFCLAMLAVCAGVACSVPAWACTLCTCTASTSGISFGTYDPTSSVPTDTSGTISLNCTGLASLFGTIEISASAGSSGDATQRTMTQGPDLLNYNLYTDNTRTIIFGDGTGGTSTMSAPLNGLLSFSQSLPVYARTPKNQWVKAGGYSDSVIITITY